MRIKVLHIFFILCCITNLIFTMGNLDTKSVDNGISAPENSVDSQSIQFNSRASRDAKDSQLSNIISRMQITNGIDIQQELRDKSFVSDQFIAELFNYGDFSAPSIYEIEDSKLDNALKSIDGLVPETAMVKTAEDYLLNVESQLHSSNFSNDIKQWFKAEKYSAEMRRIGGGNYNFTPITETTDFLEFWVLTEETLVEQNSEEEYDSIYKRTLEQFKTFTESVFNHFKSFETYLSSTMSQLTAASADVGPLVQLSTVFGKIFQGNQPTKEVLKQFQSYIHGISNAVESANVFKLVHPSSKNNQKYTFGFVNGYTDLVKLSEDVNSQWVKENEIESRLKSQLESLKHLESPLKSMGKVFEQLSSHKLSNVSYAIREYDELVSQLPIDSFKSLESISTCFKHMPKNTVNLSSITELKDVASDTDKMLDKLKIDSNQMSVILNNATIRGFYKEIIDLCSISESSDKLREVSENLFKYPHLTATVDITTNLRKLLNNFEFSEYLEAVNKSILIAKVVKNNADLENLVNIVDCLLQNRNGLEATEKLKGVEANKNWTLVRELLKNGLNTLKSITTSKGQWKSLKSTLENVQNALSSLSIVQLPNAARHSKVIGASTKALMSLNNLVTRNNGIELIRSNLPMIQAETAKSTQLSIDDRNNIGRLQLLVDYLDSFVKNSQPWIKALSAINHSKLTDLMKLSTDFIKTKLFDFQSVQLSFGKLSHSIPDSASVKPAINSVLTELLIFQNEHRIFEENKEDIQKFAFSIRALDLHFKSSLKNISNSTSAPLSKGFKIFLASIMLLTFFSLIMGGYLTMRIYRMDGFNLNVLYRPPDSEIATKKKKKDQ